ncbi:MAG: hypothetical protein V2J07_01045 [Anaerolineae bacterium]|jgi:hypothetical protein|nr:hypothetical protein [Anaerolineae bacterium]
MQEKTQAMIDRLLHHTEPAIRLKTMVDVLGKPLDDPEVKHVQQELMESVLVKTLIAQTRDENGELRSSYSKWRGGHWCLATLADFHYPKGDERLLPMRDAHIEWFFSERWQTMIRKLIKNGLQRRCASQEGNAIFSHLRLGIANDRIHDLAAELVAWQWPDGGWNCDKDPAAHTSSFHETLIPLRALVEYNRHFDNPDTKTAAERAKEVFLTREMMYGLRSGEIIHPNFAKLYYPYYWHYGYLIGLKVIAEGGWIDDPRCQKALEYLQTKQLPDGGFPAEKRYYQHSKPTTSGYTLVDWGGVSKKNSNLWVTVEVLGVLSAACCL